MRFQIEVGGKVRDVAIESQRKGLAVRLDGTPVNAEVLSAGDGRLALRLPETGRQKNVVVARGQDGDVDVLVGGLRVPTRVRPEGRGGKRSARQGDAPERVV